MSNKFLERDGYINVTNFVELAKAIDRVAAKEQLKVSEIHFAAKAIVKFDATKAKQLGDAFTKKRAQLVKMKTRMPQAGARMRMVVLLRDYKGLSENFPEFNKDFDLALAAIESHNAKAEAYIGKSKAEGAKKREAANKQFDKDVDSLMDVLLDGGVKETNIAVGTSMMGKTVIVKLPNGGYVSIGKADAERFTKAKSADAPAKSKKAPAKSAVKNTSRKKVVR